MSKTFREILYLLSLEGKKRLYWLTLAVVVMAVLDMVGVASIFPFLNVLSDPDVIEQNSKLKWIYDKFHFTGKNAFLIALGSVSFVILVANNILRAVISVALVRYGYGKRHILSKELLTKYLYEPYAFFLNRNTSELTFYLVSEVTRVVNGVLIPCLQVFARSLTALFIVALLIVINPVVAFVIIAVIGGSYIVIYAFVQKSLTRSGKEITEHSRRMHKSLNEAFGGIKDIKLFGREQIFIEKFSNAVRRICDCHCWQFITFQVPRYALEVLVFGGVLFIAIFIAVIQENYQNVIPIVGLYAFAAVRLMPTLQQVYLDIAKLRASLPAFEVVYQDYTACLGKYKEDEKNLDQTMPFLNEIEFHNISFRYPKVQEYVIEDLNLRIKSNTTVGLVGGSGAGKTTLVDILLGLLRPSGGMITVDGETVNDSNLRSWQKNIGYVPQNIHICDDTVTRNIAFGVPDNIIDLKLVQKAAELASIHDFITDKLPNGYETEIGERGVRLSGGQRQRIGIARALYYDPPLLVFDEATSALDGITEDIILEAIHNLAHRKTIILIAHRLSTVKKCDNVYLIDCGKIVDHGTYDELLSKNRQFQKMAKISTEE